MMQIVDAVYGLMALGDVRAQTEHSVRIVEQLAVVDTNGSATPVPEPTDTPALEPETEPEEVEEETITRADADLVIWADDTRAPALEPVAEAFRDEYGITVAIQEVGFGDICDNVKLAAPAGEGPDVFIARTTALANFMSMVWLLPLT